MSTHKFTPNFKLIHKQFGFIDKHQRRGRSESPEDVPVPTSYVHSGSQAIDYKIYKAVEGYAAKAGCLSIVNELCWFILYCTKAHNVGDPYKISKPWQQSIFDERAQMAEESEGLDEFLRQFGDKRWILTVSLEDEKGKTLKFKSPHTVSKAVIAIRQHFDEQQAIGAIKPKRSGGPRENWLRFMRAEDSRRILHMVVEAKGEKIPTDKDFLLVGQLMELAGNPFKNKSGQVYGGEDDANLLNNVKKTLASCPETQ